jgi:hypothetical protein
MALDLILRPNESMDAVEKVADRCEDTVGVASAIAIRAF